MLSKKIINLKNLIIKKNKIPVLNEKNILKEALEAMSYHKYGVSFCVDDKGKLIGVLTDGDIRRKILDIQKPFSALLNDDIIKHINKKPSKIKINQSLSTALKLMKKKLIWDLPAVDKDNKLIGMLHLHPIVKLLLKK
ncbi:CBS domain-containing protein [Candidatus Pelagibacter sp.]|nr:CBS domain-containing protein [Candidatus Pelagibacter sp.]